MRCIFGFQCPALALLFKFEEDLRATGEDDDLNEVRADSPPLMRLAARLSWWFAGNGGGKQAGRRAVRTTGNESAITT